jgi:hypothetical protein
MQLCWAGCPGGFRGTAFYARFTRLIVSRTRGAYASPRHLGERNCTSTAPKLSKTSAVLPPHPWHLCHFEGTDRSFAMYAAFPHADYYAQSDCLQGLRRFGAGLPSLLSTVLRIPFRLSRGLCRKVAFWRQNPKMGYWKINGLRASTFLFSVICDRAVF